MINVKNVGVFGIPNAIKGMRNPMESWDKSDSYFINDELGKNLPMKDIFNHLDDYPTFEFKVGPEDLNLALSLVKAGPDHSKFMRQIFVSFDIVAPDYWWKEMDTYKVATVANSTSTMHKLGSRLLTEHDFSWDDLPIHRENLLLYLNGLIADFQFYSKRLRRAKMTEIESPSKVTCNAGLNCLVMDMNILEDKKERTWRRIIQDLPMSFNYTRTWTGNYQNLRNQYGARKKHKQSEWREFCGAFKSLPYSELITVER